MPIPEYTSGLGAGSQRVQRVAAASAGTDAAQWQQVQDLVATTVEGKTYKDAVRMATTGALAAVTYSSGAGTLTETANGALANIDSTAAIVGDRVLIKDQASLFQNGIYTITDLGSAGTPFVLTRALDASTATELRDGTSVMVQVGTVHASRQFTQTATIANFTADSQIWTNTTAQTYTANNGVQIIANVASVLLDTGSGMVTGAGGLKNDWAVTARKASADSAASATLVLTHNWNTRDVHVSVRDTTTHGLEQPEVTLGLNDVTITWPSAVGAGAKRATVIG